MTNEGNRKIYAAIADTKAFEKAAAFFGAGRQAYEGSLGDDGVPSDSPVQAEHQRAPIAPAGMGPPPSPRPRLVHSLKSPHEAGPSAIVTSVHEADAEE